MKKFKRVCSIIISVLLVIGAIPFSGMIAFAADKVNVNTISVTVNKDYLPKDGLDCCVKKDFITTSSGDVYEKDSYGEWFDDVKDPKNQSFTGTRWYDINSYPKSVGYEFEAGRSYYFCLGFKIKSQFTSSHTFPKGDNVVKFEVKNLSKSEYEVYATNNRGGDIYVILKFKAPGERTYNDIEKVHAQVSGPNSYQGNTLPPYCNKTAPWITTEYRNYELSFEWLGDFYKENSFNKFIAGNTYQLILTYTAKSGYKFSEDCKFMFATDDIDDFREDTSIKAKPQSTKFEDGRKKFIVTFEFTISDYEYINTLVLENDFDDSTDFLPRANQRLYSPSEYLRANNYRYPYKATYTYDFYEAATWRDDTDAKIIYGQTGSLCYFTYHFVVDDSNKYRFAENLEFQINGIDSKYFWTEYELKEDNKVVYVTYYFITDYHLPPQVGTKENRFQSRSYKSFKFALENKDIEYIELITADDALPFRDYETAEQVTTIKRAPAIVVDGSHDVEVTGNSYFKINQVDTTAYFPYDDFIYIPYNSSLSFNGDGKITLQFYQPNYPSAILFNKGTLNIDETKFYAEACDISVYPQVINNRGTLNIYGGDFHSKNTFPLENGTVILNHGSKTYIDGGVFNATYGQGAPGVGSAGTNYGLMINDTNLSLEINRGVFKSSGGIKLPDNTSLDEYAPYANHQVYCNGTRYETYQINSDDLYYGETKIVELLSEFETRVNVPVNGKYPSDTVYIESDKYVLQGTPKWYCDYEEMDINNETFKLGCEYKVEFTLKTVTENCVYREPDKSLLKAYVNGKEADTYSSVDNKNTIVVTYEFGTCYDAITKAAVTGLNTPYENDTPDTSISVVTEDVNLYNRVSGGVKWYKYLESKNDAVEMQSGETFASGYNYYVKIKLVARDPRVFNYNEWGYACMDGYIDGYSCNVTEEWISNNQINNKYIYLEQDFYTCADTEIEVVDIRVEEPWAGMRPSYSLEFDRTQYEEKELLGAYDEKYVSLTPYITEKMYYGKNGVMWYDLTAQRYLYDFDTFIEGHEYEIIINLHVKGDYLFNYKYYESLVNAFVNGEEADEIQAENAYYGLKLTKTFVCKSAVDIYDITGDKQFDIRDIVRTKRIAIKFTSSFSINPDFDENGYVDSWDLVTIRKALLRYKKK